MTITLILRGFVSEFNTEERVCGMKMRFVQTYAAFKASYAAIIGDSIVYTAELTRDFKLGVYADFLQGGQLKYRLCFDDNETLKNLLKFNPPAGLMPFNIWSPNNELLGHIGLKRTKSFSGYEYYEYDFYGVRYLAYGVGMGKDGRKIPIYQNDRQIALIEKNPVVYDTKDEYDIYAIDGNFSEVAAIFNLYYDFVRFARFNVTKTKKTEYLYTLNKELKSKYNPDFKRLCQ